MAPFTTCLKADAATNHPHHDISANMPHESPLLPSQPRLTATAPELRTEVLSYILPRNSVVIMRDKAIGLILPVSFASDLYTPDLSVLAVNRIFRADGLALFWQSKFYWPSSRPEVRRSMFVACETEHPPHPRIPRMLNAVSTRNSTAAEIQCRLPSKRCRGSTGLQPSRSSSNTTAARKTNCHTALCPWARGGATSTSDPDHRIEPHTSEMVLDERYGVSSRSHARHIRHYIERKLTAEQQNALVARYAVQNDSSDCVGECGAIRTRLLRFAEPFDTSVDDGL